MLTILPSTSLFIFTLRAGTFIALSSPNWIVVWAGLEINLLSFIPLIIQAQSHNETEGAVKYFLTQALGSSLLLYGASLFYYSPYTNISSFAALSLLTASLLIKIGAAPFHFWFPSVISILRWPLCFVLATWQKIAPLILASSAIPIHSSNIFVFLGALGALIGGVGGLNQSQLRGLLAYSSIGHLGWIVRSFILGQPITIYYLLIYILIRRSLFIILHTLKSNSRNTSSIFSFNPLRFSIIIIILLSLGGMPPLLGFIPKWIILEALVNGGFLLASFILISGSLINLFYYISLFINFFLAPLSITFTKQFSHPSPIPAIIASLTILFSPALFILYAMTVFHKS